MTANSDGKVRLLLTCVGRRVQLVEAFRAAALRLKLPLTIHGADAGWHAPALRFVDRRHLLAPISAGRYIDDLRALVKRERIQLLIPLIDSELQALADHAESFRQLGCLPVISSGAVVAACRDKLATARLLRRAGIATPRTWALEEALKRRRHRFPYYMKPRMGSAAVGNYIIEDIDDLIVLGHRVENAIVQEFVQGTEYTLDVYCGMDGAPWCIVPRRRLEVRTGEVSKGVIVKDNRLMALGRRVAETLRECRGLITVQCIVDRRGVARVIEINPRFGGGAPLSIHAGADFPRWILMEALGRRPRIRPDGYRDDVAMLRYDDAVFVERSSRFTRRVDFPHGIGRAGRSKR